MEAMAVVWRASAAVRRWPGGLAGMGAARFSFTRMAKPDSPARPGIGLMREARASRLCLDEYLEVVNVR